VLKVKFGNLFLYQTVYQLFGAIAGTDGFIFNGLEFFTTKALRAQRGTEFRI
jgi:hypothetical protein